MTFRVHIGAWWLLGGFSVGFGALVGGCHPNGPNVSSVVVISSSSATPVNPPATPTSKPWAAPLPAPNFAQSVKSPLDKVVEVSTGAYHACARRVSGAVDCWGILPRQSKVLSRPSKIIVGEVVQLVSNEQITCMLERSGAVKCFSYAISPQGNALEPTTIDGISDGVSIAVGTGGHGTSQENAQTLCAIRKDRSVACWTGTPDQPASKPVAIQVKGLPSSKFITVNSNFGSYACALDSQGGMRCWNMTETYVELEGDTHPGKVHPVTASVPWVVRGVPPFDQIAVSWRGGCGRKPGGKAICFGRDAGGAPGDRDFVASSVLSEPEPLFDGVEAFLWAGCARMTGGRVVCKGDPGESVSGVAGATNVSMSPLLAPSFACGVLFDGAVACRGSNDGSTLGGYSTIPLGSASPLGVVALDQVIDIAADEMRVCALRVDGELRCWGALGEGGQRSVPLSVAFDVRAVAGGHAGICAIVDSNEQVACLDPTSGTLKPIAGFEHVLEVKVNHRQIVARSRDRRVMVRGLEPSKIDSFPVSVELVDDALLGSCALRSNPGEVLCWKNSGTSGPPTSAPHPIGVNDAVELVDSGTLMFCARRSNGKVVCWGSSLVRAPDDDPFFRKLESSDVPIEIPEISDAISMATSGAGALCVVRASGATRCFGGGTPGYEHFHFPGFKADSAQSALHELKKVALGEAFGCALQNNGLVSCWGRNLAGELGDGSLVASENPVRVPGL